MISNVLSTACALDPTRFVAFNFPILATTNLFMTARALIDHRTFLKVAGALLEHLCRSARAIVRFRAAAFIDRICHEIQPGRIARGFAPSFSNIDLASLSGNVSNPSANQSYISASIRRASSRRPWYFSQCAKWVAVCSC